MSHQCKLRLQNAQDLSTVIYLTSRCHYVDADRLTLCVSGDRTAISLGLVSVGIALSSKIEHVLLGWISVGSRLFAV